MSRIKLLRWCTRLAFMCFGRRAGSVRVLQYMFRWFVRMFVREQYVVVDVNEYKLGISLGDGRTFNGEALGLMFGNGYEVQMTKVFKAVVKPGMVVVDVGAHIGYYTLLASRLVGNTGRVWAFEPEPISFAQLDGNLKLNNCGNVTALPKAVGDSNKKSNLYLYGGFSGEFSLVDIGKDCHASVEVDVVRLDACIKGMVDVVKIDVDGGEMGVVRGMAQVDNPQLMVFTEVWKRGLGDAGYSCEQYWALLLRHGFYNAYLINEAKKKLEIASLGSLLTYVNKFGGVNLLCCRQPIDDRLFL